jgi:hypothetical protein
MNAGLIPHGDTAGQLFGDLPAKTKGTQSWAKAFLKKGTCLFFVIAVFVEILLYLYMANEPGDFICSLT